MKSGEPPLEGRQARQVASTQSRQAPYARFGVLAVARSHWVFLLLLVSAAALRFVFWQQLHPALMFADSWVYLNDVRPLGYLTYRPAGYVFILAALGAERSLAAVTALQHVAGLIAGFLIYVLCLRQGLSKALAMVPAALFLFNAFTVVLEQYLLTEAFFGLLLLVALGMAVEYPNRPVPIAMSGMSLALATLLRGAGMFAVPFWLGWLIWKNVRNPKILAVPLLAFVLPVGAYIAHRNTTTDYGTLSMIRGDGWFLYGRAMSFADCAEVELALSVAPLCPPDERPLQLPEWYVWALDSPARTLYQDDDPSHNAEVRGVALEIIKQQPASYVRAVGRDFLRAFVPGGGGHEDPSLVLVYDGEDYAFDITFWPPAIDTAQKYNLEYQTPRVSRDSFLAHYWRLARLPGVVLGLSGVLMLMVLVRRTWRSSPRAQAALMLGSTGFGMHALAVATHTFGVRFLVPVVPLITVGAVLALSVVGEHLSLRLASQLPDDDTVRGHGAPSSHEAR